MAIFGLYDANYTADVAAGSATGVTVGGTEDFYQMFASGTWGSGTLALVLYPDGSATGYTVGSLTANGVVTANVKKGDVLKAVLSGSTSPDLDIVIR